MTKRLKTKIETKRSSVRNKNVEIFIDIAPSVPSIRKTSSTPKNLPKSFMTKKQKREYLLKSKSDLT